MHDRTNKLTLRPALPQDNDGIRSILSHSGTGGSIDVQQLRGESPLTSYIADGDDVRLITADDAEIGRLAAVGGVIMRTEYLGGIPSRCAYLPRLRIHKAYQSTFRQTAEMYALLGAQLSDCACCYTAVPESDARLIGILEQQHRSLPAHRYLGKYTVYCFRGDKKLLPLQSRRDGFDTLMHLYYSQYALTPCKPDYAGFGKRRFFGYRRNGELLACCFVSDQQQTKSYKIRAYHGACDKLTKLPVQLTGYPQIPSAGSEIRHGVVSYLYVRDNDPALCRRFLRSVAAVSGFPLLIWGGYASHPLSSAVRHMRSFRFGFRLYEVLWDGAAPAINGKIGLEAALI